MSVTIYRAPPTGTIAPEAAEQLQLELSAADIGTVCEGVGITVGAPNDTIELIFAAAPDEVEVDAVIAAHPSYTFGFATSASFVADTWLTVWSRPMARRGEWLHADAEVSVRIGDETDMQVSTLYVGVNVRRRQDGSVVVLSGFGGSPDGYGEIPLISGRFIADGVFVRFQLQIGVTANAVVIGKVVEEEGEVFA